MQSHRFKLASLACVIALCGCGADHAGRNAGKVVSISDFRAQTTGTWCFLDKANARVLKIQISPAGQYILDYRPADTSSSATWTRSNHGIVGYGQGRFSDDGSKYYFAHLSGTAINFSINDGTPVTTMITRGIPVLFDYGDQQGPELHTQYITRDCKLIPVGSGLNPSDHP